MNDHIGPTHTGPTHTGPDTDARIDAMARAAGSQLRRPAPADGIGRAQRSTRTRQAVRAGVAGAAVVAVVGIGVFALTNRDGATTVVPATTPSTDPDTTSPDSVAPGTTSATEETLPATTEAAPPTSVEPLDSTPVVVPPNAAGAPTAVYATEGFYVLDGDQTVLDPITGAILRSEPIDWEASLAAQEALQGRAALPYRSSGESSGPDDFGYLTAEWDVGPITYAQDSLPSEVPTLESFSSETRARFDRCGQSELRVSGARASTLPDRVFKVMISPDARWMIVLSAECTEGGTLADGPEVASRPSLGLFDASRPDLPGRTLVQDGSRYSSEGVTFDVAGRFVAVGTDEGLRFFELESAAELAVVPAGCSASGTKWARLIGPWIGDSSVAVQLSCGTTSRLFVHDLASSESLDVGVPAVAESFDLVADVDFAHYDRPANTWFTLCALSADATVGTVATCWLGQGSGPLIELPGVSEASFLPLGFTYGG